MIRCLLLLTLLLGGGLARAQAPAPADELIDEGLALYAGNLNAEALDRFERALKLRPGDFRAQYGVALVDYTTGHYAEAAALCAQLVKREDKLTSNLYVTYGTSLDRQQKSTEAVQVYQEALRRFPADEPLWRYQGIALRSLHRYDEAATSLQQAIRLRADKVTTHLLLAATEASRQQRVPALLAALRALTLMRDRSQVGPALDMVDELLPAGPRKTGRDQASPQAKLSPDLVRQAEQPGSFATIELMLKMLADTDYGTEHQAETAAERLARKLTTLGKGLGGHPAEARQGFYWEYYAPFFSSLQQQGHAPTLAYLLESLRPGEPSPDVSSWLRLHPQQVADFRQWCAAYRWPAAPGTR